MILSDFGEDSISVHFRKSDSIKDNRVQNSTITFDAHKRAQVTSWTIKIKQV